MDPKDLSADRSLIEFPELLDVREEQSSPVTENNNHVSNDVEMVVFQKPVAATVASTNSLTPTKAIHKQIESRTSDGKKRITPIFIPKEQSVR